jgi:hypothetical protein
LGQKLPWRAHFEWSVCLGEFNRSVQHQSQSIGWGFEAQGLSRALIEPQGDRVEVGLGEAREISSFREVLSQQAVGVLVAAALQGLRGSQK